MSSTQSSLSRLLTLQVKGMKLTKTHIGLGALSKCRIYAYGLRQDILHEFHTYSKRLHQYFDCLCSDRPVYHTMKTETHSRYSQTHSCWTHLGQQQAVCSIYRSLKQTAVRYFLSNQFKHHANVGLSS